MPIAFTRDAFAILANASRVKAIGIHRELENSTLPRHQFLPQSNQDSVKLSRVDYEFHGQPGLPWTQPLRGVPPGVLPVPAAFVLPFLLVAQQFAGRLFARGDNENPGTQSATRRRPQKIQKA